MNDFQDIGYCYPPDFVVLKNKPGIKDSVTLAEFEREAVSQRIAEGAPQGDFSLSHLQSIHHHLFQDVYEWAGEVRQVEIQRDGYEYTYQQAIEHQFAFVHQRLHEANYLKDLSRDEFAVEAAKVIGDTNFIHPFREGNTRSQLQYLKQLAEGAGLSLDIVNIDRDEWVEATRSALDKNPTYDPLAQCIATALTESENQKSKQQDAFDK